MRGKQKADTSAARAPASKRRKPVLLRPFRESDRQALEEIFILARRQAFFWVPPEKFRRRDLAPSTADELIWVAKSDGHVAGFISIWVPASFIHNLFVHPSFQGRGIGTALMEKAVELVPMPLTLKCKVRNRRACDFYEHRGWRPVRKEGDQNGSYWVYKLV